MFKSKGAILGVAVALVASVLLVAGMAVTTTSGAGTDTPFGGAPSGFPDPTGNPPAAEDDEITDPGTNPTDPAGTTPGAQPATGVDPTGAPGAGGTAPGSLPSAGFGVAESGSTAGAMVILLAVAGVALMGAGAAAVGANKRG
jgi:hypothetical protein